MKNKILFLLRNPLMIPIIILAKLPYFKFIRKTNDYQCRITFKMWFFQKVLNFGGNRSAYWPMHWTSTVYDSDKVLVGVDSYPGFMQGCYIQGMGGIEIGNYTQIAPNVVIVSANHNLYDSREHIRKRVKIGSYCWIGAGAKILPGVELGDWTIVGAGAVVSKSFPEGYCVIGGNSASKIKDLDREKCIPFRNQHEFNGYIESTSFNEFRKRHLNI